MYKVKELILKNFFFISESGVNAEVVRAVDINTTANVVYRLNFPGTILLEKNIQSLDDTDFTKVNIQMILMSPPCQPHTRWVVIWF